MKSFTAIVLCALLLLTCATTLADAALSQNPTLTNPALLRPIQQTEYAGWTLYQPTSSEIVGEDMTTDSGFAHRRFFPVVAVQDNLAVLILLKRVDDGWSVFDINKTALNRPGLTLSQFTIDSNGAYEQAEGTGLPVYFIFSDGEGWHYQLGLTATDIYTTRFDFITFTGMAGPMPKTAERLFADTSMLFFNSGFIFIYDYLFPTMQLQYSINAITGESDYDNFATFDLSRVPWSIFEAMEPCAAYSDASIHGGKILLKQFCSSDAATLCEIPSGAPLLREADLLNLEGRDWVLVSYGQTLGYLPKSNIMP